MNNLQDFVEIEEEFLFPSKKGVFHALEPYLHKPQMLYLESCAIDQPAMNGFLVGLSEDLGVMHFFNDFVPYGYEIFHLSDIESITSNQHERFWSYMLHSEGLLGGLDLPLSLDLKSVRSAIESVQQQFSWLIAEIENPGGELGFHIGQLNSIDENGKVRMRCFDNLGVWGYSLCEFPLEDVFLIQFETPYIKAFRKYLSEGPSLKIV